eukprot:scaffold4958_cov406-Prasinococcus_capsulatus_cf.AAC.5
MLRLLLRSESSRVSSFSQLSTEEQALLLVGELTEKISWIMVPSDDHGTAGRISSAQPACDSIGPIQDSTCRASKGRMAGSADQLLPSYSISSSSAPGHAV